MRDALVNFAKKMNVSPESVSIRIYTEDQDKGMPSYFLMQNLKPVREVTFSEILDVKIDFLNREAIATPFLAKALQRLSLVEGMSLLDISVFVMYNPNDKETPLLYMYNKMQGVRYLSFEKDIFNE